MDASRWHEFDTILGRIGFDEKGDVIGYATFVWNVWKDGKFAPIEPGTQTELRPSPATAYGRQR